MSLEKYYNIVEEGIKMTGIDPVLSRDKEAGQWIIASQATEIWIDVIDVPESGRVYFQVMCPFSENPAENREAFFQELLEASYQIIDAHFVCFNEGIYLKIMRDIDRMASDDVLLALNRVGFYGTEFAKNLFGKYNLQKLEHHDHD